MDSTRGPDNDTPSPPDAMSKSMNISQSKSKLTDSGSYQVTSSPTLQGRPSYVSTNRNPLVDEHLNNAASSNSTTASGEPLQREPHPSDNQMTAIPGVPSGDRQAITERRDASQFDIGSDVRPPASQVSPHIVAALPPVILTSGPQLWPPFDADNTQSVTPRRGRRESYTARGRGEPVDTEPKWVMYRRMEPRIESVPCSSAPSSRQLTSQLHYVNYLPRSRNLLRPPRSPALRSNTLLGSSGSEETREMDESSSSQVDSPRERTVIRPHAEQVDRTAFVHPPAMPSTPSPFPLDRWTTSASPILLPYPQGSAWAKRAFSQMHAPRSTLPYEPRAPSRGTPFELPHPPGEDRGKARPDDQGKDSPAAQHGPSAPSEHTPATTESPTQDIRTPLLHHTDHPHPPENIPAATPHPFRQERSPSSVPRRLHVPPEHSHAMTELPSLQDRKDPSATPYKLSVPPPTWERKGRKRVMVHEEHENRLKDSADAEPNPTTSSAPDVVQNSEPPLEGSVQRTYSPYLSREYDSSAPYPPSTNPLQRPPSPPGDSQPLATSSDKSSIVLITFSLTADMMSLFVSPIAQPVQAIVNAASNLEKRRESQAQPRLFHPESPYSLEQPAATGLSLPQYLLQSRTGLSPSPVGDMKQGVVSPARLQQGRGPNRGSSQSSLHPGVVDQEISSRPSTRTSSEVRDGLVIIQPEPLEFEHPLALRVRDGLPMEDGPPPPGLRKKKEVEPPSSGPQIPEKSSTFCCFARRCCRGS
jgi:hypothetical protein